MSPATPDDKVKLVSPRDGIAEIEDRPPVPPKAMPDDIDNKPITHFFCHTVDRAKARKHLQKMARTEYDPEIRQLILDIPLHTQSGIKKNVLVAMSEAASVFYINIKTGRMFHL